MNFKKSLPALLALLVLSQTMTACGDSAEPTTAETESDILTAAQTEAPVDPRIQQKADYFAALDHTVPAEPITFTFISDTDDIAVEAENGEKLNDAMYRRNIEIEEKLGYKIVDIKTDIETDTVAKVKNSVMSGDGAYDAVSTRTYMVASLFSGGYLRDLNDFATLQLDQPWWNQTANQNMSFGGVRYCGLSALCHRADTVCELVLMNKRIAEELDMEVPYQAVREGKWTWEMLHSMIKQVPLDSNGDGQMDHTDVVGMVGQSQDVAAATIACGMTFFEKDADDIAVFTLNKEENASKFQTIFDFFNDKTYVYCVGLYKGIDWDYWGTKFLNGESLFMLEFPGNFSVYTNMEDDYGVLPMPKYDQAQENYRTMTNLWHTSALCIPRVTSVSDAEVGLVLDAMSFLSYVDVEPMFAETYLENRYIRDEDSAEMINIVLGSMYYDPCFAIYETWGYPINIPLTSLQSGTNTFSSTVAKQQKGIEKAIEKTKNYLENY